jgi:hypothetical protein
VVAALGKNGAEGDAQIEAAWPPEVAGMCARFDLSQAGLLILALPILRP